MVGLYRPPVFKRKKSLSPPQTIISLPVQTAVCHSRPSGALVVLVAVQLSVLGLYLPPVFVTPTLLRRPRRSFHCQSNCRSAPSGSGGIGGVVGVHVSSVQPPEGPAITGSW